MYSDVINEWPDTANGFRILFLLHDPMVLYSIEPVLMLSNMLTGPEHVPGNPPG